MILTQDKDKIVSTENLNYIQVEETELNYRNYKYDIKAYFGKDNVLLGRYETSDRGNAILQDMYKQIMMQNFSFTYQMPKE